MTTGYGGVGGGSYALETGQVLQFGSDVYNWYTTQNGGSTGTGRCPGEPTPEQMATTLAALSDSERARLKQLWNDINGHRLTYDAAVSQPGVFAHALMGGDDCSVSRGSELSTYGLSLVSKYAQTGPIRTTTSGTQAVVDAGRGIIDDLKQVVVNTLRGGLEGASTASGGAASGSRLGTPVVLIGGILAVVLLVWLMKAKG